MIKPPICSYQGCSKNFIMRNSLISENLSCLHCKDVPYCSPSCMEMDWQVHKAVCKQRSRGTATSTTKSGKRKPEDFEVLQNRQELGQGSFGTVLLVKDRSNGQLYAMKMMEKSQLYKYCSIENLKKEIKIQRKLDHPHITKLYSYFEDKENVYLILEYADKGSLFNTLRKRRAFSEQEAFVYFFQTSLGIDYLHKRNIIHRDLKPENLLLDKFGNIKICDFGWSTDAGQVQRNSYCGTVEYMPPEMIRNEPHNYKLDVWGLGVLLYELTHGKPPFTGRNDQEKCKAILDNRALKFASHISSDAQHLIRFILNPNPKERPTIRQIFTHKWMVQKQQEHRINLLDYLWDEAPQSQPLAQQQRKTVPTQPKPTSSYMSQNTSPDNYQQRQHDTQFQSAYSYSSRPFKSQSPLYGKNLSTADLVAMYSKNRKNTAISDRDTDIQSQQQRVEEKQPPRPPLEGMTSARPLRGVQEQPRDQGFFERLFTTLGCLNRDKAPK